MTTIGPGSGAATSTAGSSSGGGGDSQIAAITKQITQLTNKLKDLASDSTMDAKDKKVMQDLVQGQIQMLEAQIAQIQQQQAQQAVDKQQASQEEADRSSTKAADGINRPTKDNVIDVYI